MNTLDGQSCADTIDVRQIGTTSVTNPGQVIVPQINFSCSGRITGYAMSLRLINNNTLPGRYPIIQVWHPTSLREYQRVETECPFIFISLSNMNNLYMLLNVSCTGSNRIEFQSGDVIGYLQPNETSYALWSIENATGYMSFYDDREGSPPTVDLHNFTNESVLVNTRPLIEVLYGKICSFLWFIKCIALLKLLIYMLNIEWIYFSIM